MGKTDEQLAADLKTFGHSIDYFTSLGVSLEKYSNETLHEDSFNIIFKIPSHSGDKNIQCGRHVQIYRSLDIGPMWGRNTQVLSDCYTLYFIPTLLRFPLLSVCFFHLFLCLSLLHLFNC